MFVGVVSLRYQHNTTQLVAMLATVGWAKELNKHWSLHIK